MKILQCCTGCVCMVLVICLAGCGVPGAVSSPSVVPRSPSVVPKAPSPTAVPSSMPTLEVPTGTPTPSLISPTRTPRPTPVPTMTAGEEQALVLELLRDNGGCRLPCWWGFTPGETPWETAQTYFLSVGKKIGKYHNSRFTHYEVDFAISQHQVTIDQLYVVNEDEIIDKICVVASSHPDHRQELVEDMQRYSLSQLLADYGQPSQVLLKTFSGVPEGLPPFHLLLYYPQQGIMVRYIDDAERSGETLRLCPRQPGVTLWLWAPGQGVHIADIADTGLGGFPKNELTYFRSLEEATGMSVEQFYETFVQPDAETCLETPADLW